MMQTAIVYLINVFLKNCLVVYFLVLLQFIVNILIYLFSKFKNVVLYLSNF